MAKISISIPDALHRQLTLRATPGYGATSGAIQRAVDRYLEVCRRALPALRVDEWELIMDSLLGTLHDTVAALEQGVADSIRLDLLDKKWGVDGDALLSKLASLDYAGRVAIVDYAERYWAAVTRGEVPRVPGEED
jgi:hypothetical protein